ncbi:MAG: hypothetical protein ABII25_03110 [bacterium]
MVKKIIILMLIIFSPFGKGGSRGIYAASNPVALWHMDETTAIHGSTISELSNFNLSFDRFRAVDVNNSYHFPLIFEISGNSEIFIGHDRIVVRDDNEMRIGWNFIKSLGVFKDIFHPFSVKVKIFSNNFIFCHLFPPQKNGGNVANFVSSPVSRKSKRDYMLGMVKAVFQKSRLDEVNLCEQNREMYHSEQPDTICQYRIHIAHKNVVFCSFLYEIPRADDLDSAVTSRKDIRFCSQKYVYQKPNDLST